METVLLFLANIVLPYLIMSFLCMIMLEMLSGMLNLRGLLLSRTIRQMLGAADAAAFYDHPVIRTLSTGRPSAYIPARLFSVVLLDRLRASAPAKPRSGSEAMGDELSQVLRALLRHVPPGGEPRAIQDWYNDVMDQAAGVYRLRVTRLLAILAVGLVVPLNLDAIRISAYLLERPAAAEPEARAAGQAKPEPREVAAIPVAHLPIEWTGDRPARVLPPDFGWFLLKLVGLFVSVVSIIAGAPFLFDTLNRFMIVRSTVKPIDHRASPPAAEGKPPAVAPED